jgi:hypothetical protein
MLHAGLDLSRRRLDVCLLDEHGELVAETAAPPDADGLRGLARRLAGQRVRAVIESMNGARFVHDTLEEVGWEVLVADAQRVKGWRRWPARPTRSTRACLRCCRSATWCRRSGCPTRASGASASWLASGFTWCVTARRSRTASTRR